jgi:hypothetical protein
MVIFFARKMSSRTGFTSQAVAPFIAETTDAKIMPSAIEPKYGFE